MKKTNIMVDLETLGTTPGSVILSIGAVVFCPLSGLIKSEFLVNIDIGSSIYHGLTISTKTVGWWHGQKYEAKKAALMPPQHLLCNVTSALTMFEDFIVENGGADAVNIWGNGSDFDNAILAKAFCVVHDKDEAQPWKFWNNRCYRTVKAGYPAIKIQRGKGTHHNALDDARAQALHLMKLPVPSALYN